MAILNNQRFWRTLSSLTLVGRVAIPDGPFQDSKPNGAGLGTGNPKAPDPDPDPDPSSTSTPHPTKFLLITT